MGARVWKHREAAACGAAQPAVSFHSPGPGRGTRGERHGGRAEKSGKWMTLAQEAAVVAWSGAASGGGEGQAGRTLGPAGGTWCPLACVNANMPNSKTLASPAPGGLRVFFSEDGGDGMGSKYSPVATQILSYLVSVVEGAGMAVTGKVSGSHSLPQVLVFTDTYFLLALSSQNLSKRLELLLSFRQRPHSAALIHPYLPFGFGDAWGQLRSLRRPEVPWFCPVRWFLPILTRCHWSLCPI